MAFTLQNPDATLNDKQIDSAMSRILKALESASARAFVDLKPWRRPDPF